MYFSGTKTIGVEFPHSNEQQRRTDGNSTSFNVTDLFPDTTYTFEVSAVTEVLMGSGGEGDRSNSVQRYLMSDGEYCCVLLQQCYRVYKIVLYLVIFILVSIVKNPCTYQEYTSYTHNSYQGGFGCAKKLKR